MSMDKQMSTENTASIQKKAMPASPVKRLIIHDVASGVMSPVIYNFACLNELAFNVDATFEDMQSAVIAAGIKIDLLRRKVDIAIAGLERISSDFADNKIQAEKYANEQLRIINSVVV